MLRKIDTTIRKELSVPEAVKLMAGTGVYTFIDLPGGERFLLVYELSSKGWLFKCLNLDASVITGRLGYASKDDNFERVAEKALYYFTKEGCKIYSGTKEDIAKIIKDL